MASVRLLERTPLRVELIVAVLALVTMALALISLASVTALRGYLVDRLDDQLAQVAPGYQRERPGPAREADGRPPART
jgi:two-component system OmpR family sensor kinase